MPYRNRKSTYGNFILIFVGIKILFNLLAVSHFGFHRDELLHLALGDHLAWGYKEVPPFIAFLAYIIKHILGNTLVATRVFPTVFAALIVWFTGKLVVEMGGRRLAITIACLTVIFSPAFAASDYLFQPVVFDQLWWLLAVYLLLKYLNTKTSAYLYTLGLVIGLGLLTKYTMGFFVVALLLGILITRQRKLLYSRDFFISLAIAVTVFLPNIIWQLNHHLPVATHMDALQNQQLKFLRAKDFIIQQFLVHGLGIVVWVIGLISFFVSYRLRRFMFLGIAYLLLFAFYVKMNGKHYYLFPAYPMLFAAGGYMIENWIKKTWTILRVSIIAILVLPNLILFPLVLPFLTISQTIIYTEAVMKSIPGIKFITTWEDGRQHPLTQDYADMLGWEEMVSKTAGIYHNLNATEQQQTIIIADNYGEGGAFAQFGPKYGLPAAVCLNSSFALWAPATINPKNIIYISDDGNVSDLKPLSASIVKAGVVANPLAREYGTALFIIKGVKPAVAKLYELDLKQKLAH